MRSNFDYHWLSSSLLQETKKKGRKMNVRAVFAKSKKGQNIEYLRSRVFKGDALANKILSQHKCSPTPTCMSTN